LAPAIVDVFEMRGERRRRIDTAAVPPLPEPAA
jgi:hypothetical protein